MKIQLDNIEVEVNKLPIGDYVDLIKAVKKLPKHLIKLENLDRAKIVEMIPELIGDSLPDLFSVLSVAVKLPVKEISELGLHEITRLLEGFFIVNKYDEVGQALKKVMSHPAINKYVQKANQNQAKTIN